MKIKDPFLFEQVRAYLQVYLPDQRMCSPKTIKSYREVLRMFLDYLCESLQLPLQKIGFGDITPEAVSGFLKHLAEARGCMPPTVNHHLAAIRAFLKYTGMKEPAYMDCYTKVQQVPFLKTEKKLTVSHFNENALTRINRKRFCNSSTFQVQ